MVFWSSLVFIFLIGAVLGSFTTAIVYRLQNNQSWIFADKKNAARSSCPSCDHQLSAKDLIPIFSWVLLKGRCRYCKESISRQYVFTEFISASLAIILFLCLGMSLLLAIALVMLPFVLAQTILIYQNRFISGQLSGIIIILILCTFFIL